jgi:hypothetical protein
VRFQPFTFEPSFFGDTISTVAPSRSRASLGEVSSTSSKPSVTTIATLFPWSLPAMTSSSEERRTSRAEVDLEPREHVGPLGLDEDRPDVPTHHKPERMQEAPAARLERRRARAEVDVHGVPVAHARGDRVGPPPEENDAALIGEHRPGRHGVR